MQRSEPGRPAAGTGRAVAATPKNRVIRFEIMVQRADRWVLECWMSEEAAAVAYAESLLEEDGVEAVRVTRERETPTGFRTVKPVMERQRGAPAAAPIALSAVPESEVWCESLEDFYGDASRMTIGRLLRSFLDRLNITPTELLYDYRYSKKLDAAGSLLQAAVHRMAQLQAAAQGGDARERGLVLDGLVGQAMTLARDAQASRRLPKIEADGLVGLIAAAGGGGADRRRRDFLIGRALAAHLATKSGFIDKLDAVLALAVATPGLHGTALALVDGLLADILGSATVIQDLLGHQPHLGGALIALADLATGRHSGVEPGALPALPILNALIVEKRLPACRTVLIDRLQRELAGGRPLTRGDNRTQAAVLDQLLDRLKDDRGGYLGGIATMEAAARRARRFEVIGGVESFIFHEGDTVARVEQVLKAERTLYGERAKRGVATYLFELLGHPHGDLAGLGGFGARIEDSKLLPAAKAALGARLKELAS